MFVITEMYNTSVKVLDTSDGVSERWKKDEIKKLVEETGVEIKGYIDGKFYTYFKGLRKLLNSPMGTPVVINGKTCLYIKYSDEKEAFMFYDGTLFAFSSTFMANKKYTPVFDGVDAIRCAELVHNLKEINSIK